MYIEDYSKASDMITTSTLNKSTKSLSAPTTIKESSSLTACTPLPSDIGEPR